MKPSQFVLDDAVETALAAHCNKTGMKRSEAVRRALRAYLSKAASYASSSAKSASSGRKPSASAAGSTQ